MRVQLTALVAMAVALLLFLGGSTPAHAGDYDDPFFLNWPTFVPSTTTSDFVASTENDCPKGSLKCVDNVIREMTKRYNTLGCSHNSAFAFTYLVTTQEYRKAVDDPNFFTDNAFVNHQDAGFADLYFTAYDNWKAGRIADVPPSWRIAFQAGDTQAVTGMGNVLLGMNAHVNRDLPFILASIGLVKPDGTSRKVDHDRVNAFLNAVNKYLLTEAAKYLDPTMDDGDVPGTSLDNSAAVQLLTGWREEAWRNAERLVAASTPEDRAQVATDIENAAATEGLLLKTSYSYTLNPNSSAAARNLYCTTHFVRR